MKILAAALCFLSFGCQKKTQEILINNFEREQTLYVGGFQWDKPGDFNPLSSYPSFPVSGNINLVYENLFGYNMLIGDLDPILAKKYEISDSVLSVELNEKAYWNDKTPLTAEDVIYSFYLHKKYPTHLSSHWYFIDTIYTDKKQQNVVKFKMDKNYYNPLVMQDIIGATLILPKHVFEKIEQDAILAVGNNPEAVLEKIREHKMDRNPVSSGPYMIQSYADDFIALQRDDRYWGNDAMHGGQKPAPKYIVHPIYNSNDDYNTALASGALDLSQTYFSQIREKMDSGYDLGMWSSSYIPGTITALFVNFGEATDDFTPNPALKSVDFRKAVASAINYEKIRKTAVESYVPEIRPGFIVDDNNEKLFFNTEDASKYGVVFDTGKAKDILKSAGFSWGVKGELLNSDGTKVKEVKITTPKGWTDWEAAVKIVVENLKSMGISAKADFSSEEEYWKKLSHGYFDMIMHTPMPEQSSSLPWSRFDASFTNREFEPIGVEVWANQGRYRNSAVETLLVKIPTLVSDAEIKEAYRELNRIFMIDLPVIPIMYRPSQYYQFSTKYWDNFPTDENPYAPPQLLMTGGGVKGLWGIVPKSQI